MKDWDLPTNVKSEELEPREKKREDRTQKTVIDYPWISIDYSWIDHGYSIGEIFIVYVFLFACICNIFPLCSL